MARKLFLILTLLLLVGQLTGRAIDEDGAVMSELYSGQADEMPYETELVRNKRFLGGLIRLGVRLGKTIHDKIQELRRRG